MNRRRIGRTRPRYATNPPDRVRACELNIGTEIVWRDGTTTTVREVADDEPGGTVWLELTNGHCGSVNRRRRFRVIRPLARLGSIPT